MVQRCLNFRSKKSWDIDPITKTKRVTTHYLSPNKTCHANRQNINIIHTTSKITPHPTHSHRQSHTINQKNHLSLSLSLSLSKHGGGEAEAQRRRRSRRRNCGGGSKAQQWPDFKSHRLCWKTDCEAHVRLFSASPLSLR